jgi:transmembrane sensor
MTGCAGRWISDWTLKMNSRDIHGRDGAIPLSEQAAQWWVTLHSEECTAADRRTFAEWVARSPERVEAYLRFASLSGALHSSAIRWPDAAAETLISEAKAAPSEVVSLERALPFEGEPAASDRAVALNGHARRSVLTLSAAAAVLIFAAATWLLVAAPERYQTRLGEQRSVVLDDGSIIALNTSSTVEVDFDENRRVVRLTEGEALFEVVHDAKRPFDVIAGATTVRAIGTRFNVDRRRTTTTVTVLEGRVLVEEQSRVATRSRSVSLGLAAGERVVVTPYGIGAPERVANVVPITAWTQRRLIFEGRPLGEVAAEFNRYNREQIRIEDALLRQQEVTGVFDASDPDSFVTFLSQIAGVQIEETADGHRVVKVHHRHSSTTGGPD